MLQKSSSEPVVLFADPPVLDELCGITVGVPRQHNVSQVASTWQPQILKCREFIYTEPDILATPAFDLENCFHIVLQQSVYRTGKLRSRLQSTDLEPSKPYRVTPALYQSCLRYTLMAKIAPTWNKAGEWFIQGRDFLTHTGYSSAVKMNLLVNKDELLVSLLATSVKFPPMQLLDLDVDQHVLRLLTTGHPNMIDMSLKNCWCHVLPSMKRGRICSMSTFVPPDGPFKSYRDLKRHWKNTYGYRLPDTDDDIEYYQISFRQNGGKLFSYPSICLRAMHMQQIPRIDPKPIIIAFIKDIHSKLPSICGHPLKFLPKVRYAIPELYDSAMKSKGLASNLSTKTPTPSLFLQRNIKELSHMYNPRPPTQVPVASVKELSHMYNPRPPTQVPVASVKELSHMYNPRPPTQVPVASVKELSHMYNPRPPTQVPVASVSHQSEIQESEKPGSSLQCCSTEQVSQTSACMPGPNNRWTCNSVSLESSTAICTANRNLVQLPNNSSTSYSSHASHYVTGSEDGTIPRSPPSHLGPSRIVPVFRSKTCKTSTFPRDVKTARAVPVFKPKSKTPSTAAQSYNNNKHSESRLQSVEQPGSNWEPSTCEKANGPISSAQCLTKKPTFLKSRHQPAVLNSPSFHRRTPQFARKGLSVGTVLSESKVRMGGGTTGSVGIMSRVLDSDRHQQIPSTRMLDSTNSVGAKSPSSKHGSGSFKRKTLDDNMDGCVKKPRAKPQVQDVDVEMLAKANQLSKVNSVTLLNWLRSRGAPCKSKDKKAELVQLVNHILHLHTAEV